MANYGMNHDVERPRAMNKSPMSEEAASDGPRRTTVLHAIESIDMELSGLGEILGIHEKKLGPILGYPFDGEKAETTLSPMSDGDSQVVDSLISVERRLRALRITLGQLTERVQL